MTMLTIPMTGPSSRKLFSFRPAGHLIRAFVQARRTDAAGSPDLRIESPWATKSNAIAGHAADHPAAVNASRRL